MMTWSFAILALNQTGGRQPGSGLLRPRSCLSIFDKSSDISWEKEVLRLPLVVMVSIEYMGVHAIQLAHTL
jgi:hypothetical protein